MVTAAMSAAAWLLNLCTNLCSSENINKHISKPGDKGACKNTSNWACGGTGSAEVWRRGTHPGTVQQGQRWVLNTENGCYYYHVNTFTLAQMVITSMWGLVVAPLAQSHVQHWDRGRSSTPFQMILHYYTSCLVSGWQSNFVSNQRVLLMFGADDRSLTWVMLMTGSFPHRWSRQGGK